ncbi:MAG: hypothetical protein WAM75_19270 [Xanthobacteraceae bacterium]
MPALVAGIHDLCQRGKKDVDGRNKSGHDDEKPPVLAFAGKTAVLQFPVAFDGEQKS